VWARTMDNEEEEVSVGIVLCVVFTFYTLNFLYVLFNSIIQYQRRNVTPKSVTSFSNQVCLYRYVQWYVSFLLLAWFIRFGMQWLSDYASYNDSDYASCLRYTMLAFSRRHNYCLAFSVSVILFSLWIKCIVDKVRLEPPRWPTGHLPYSAFR
jgi:hypothetical protein